MDEERRKFEIAIERAAFKYINVIKEHMTDSTHIYCNRNNIDIDRVALQNILEIARAGIEEGIIGKMDFFKEDLTKALNEWMASINPTKPTSSKKSSKE